MLLLLLLTRAPYLREHQSLMHSPVHSRRPPRTHSNSRPNSNILNMLPCSSKTDSLHSETLVSNPSFPPFLSLHGPYSQSRGTNPTRSNSPPSSTMHTSVLNRTASLSLHLSTYSSMAAAACECEAGFQAIHVE